MKPKTGHLLPLSKSPLPYSYQTGHEEPVLVPMTTFYEPRPKKELQEAFEATTALETATSVNNK